MTDSPWLTAVEHRVDAMVAAMDRAMKAYTLGPQFFFDLRCRRYPKASRKRRIAKKWRNRLLARYREWY